MDSSTTGRRRARRRRARGRGITLPMIAVAMVGICGFVALGIDVGQMAIARVHAQNAADVAAMAGARTLSGLQPQDTNAATTAAKTAAGNYKILGQAVPAANVAVTHGTYRYDYTSQQFSAQYALNTGELYNVTKATVTATVPTLFASVLKIASSTISATATAAHRPRDVVVLVDFSGSMNVESDLWNAWWPYDNGTSPPNNPNNTSNNAETVYPLFGHYSNEKNYSNYTNYANLLCPASDASNPLTGNSAIGKCNISVTALGVPPMVNDFWQNARGGAATSAFTQVPDASLDAYKQAGGDKFLRKSMNNSGQPYATNVYDVLGSTSKNTSWEGSGHQYVTGTASKGYTQGPRYWGKTFFMWPPDPKNDWRQTYFGTKDNTKLWDSSGNYRNPSGYYTINYKAILAWIAQSPCPFPSKLRSGNVLFYSAIPTDVPAAAYNPSTLNSTITDQDQRFWKEYIDFVLGVWRAPDGNIYGPGFANYGPDYTFGTIKVSSPPTDGRYMDYQDNPERPRHRMWFGPMTMIQYMICAGILPGTAHDISTFPMKNGLAGALMDIESNHPNDQVALAFYNRPQHSNDPSGVGSFNNSQYSLTNNYATLINALWTPPNSGASDVRPWDSNGGQTPCAAGHFGNNTATQYGFMLAYNQFSGSTYLRGLEQGGTTGVGGLGRVGTQKMIIYETDGLACVSSTPSSGFTNGGAYNSYYNILPGQTVSGSDSLDSNALMQVVQNICNKSDGTSGTPSGFTSYSPNQGYPGFAATGSNVQIHTLAFGMIFEAPSSTRDSCVSMMQQIAQIGGTTFPSSSADSANGYKWCTGTLNQRQTKLRQAFTNIMNQSVQITLIK